MNYFLKDVTAKLTSISILSEAQANGKSPEKVPSLKFYSSAVVSTISKTNNFTTPISVSAVGKNPTAQPFDPRNFPIKKEEIEEDNGTPTDTKLCQDHQQGCMYVYGKDSSPVESTRPDQNYIDI